MAKSKKKKFPLSPYGRTRRAFGLVKQASPLHQYRMKALEAFLLGPASKKERSLRLRRVAKLVDKSTDSIRALYLYGRGFPSDWDKVMDFISPFSQKDLIAKYDQSFIDPKNKSHFSVEKQELIQKVSRMPEEEIDLIMECIRLGEKFRKRS